MDVYKKDVVGGFLFRVLGWLVGLNSLDCDAAYEGQGWWVWLNK